MKKKDLPDFPPLFEAIGKFLREAEVPQHQQKDLMAAQKGLDIIARTLYSRQAKVYPCTGGVPRISPMPLSKVYPCTGGVPRISPMPLSRTTK